ncbi:MAG TPA: arylsulfatase [Planctomycetota bacterium]|jgi:arylsulfatase A-like enzyme
MPIIVRKSLNWIFAFALLLCAAPQAAEPTSKPNIVIILADDQGYEDTGFNGSKQIRTSNLDKLARDGSILESFYVQPCCSPTRSSLMTGRYVIRTGVYHVVHPHAQWGLPLQERTLAEALRQAGYETAICGKWHLGEFKPDYLPTHRGFDHQYGLWFGMIDYFTHKRGGDVDWHRDDKPCNDEGYSTHLIAREACRIIREKTADKPLFLYVPFNGVHAPHQVPDEYKKPFENLSGSRRTYAGMVAAMDEGVGQIVAALKEKGIFDNTLIVFSSDNGGPAPGKVTSNAPLRAGKGSIYEGGIRGCAFASWPNHIPAGKVIKEPLHVVDWYPTLIKLAGGSLEQKLPIDGIDIWPLLTTGAKPEREALLLPGMAPNQAAIRMGDWKLLLRASDTDAEDLDQLPEGKGVQLFNLAADIGESKDLAAANPEKVRELQSRLTAYLKTAVPPASLDADGAGVKKQKKRKAE